MKRRYALLFVVAFAAVALAGFGAAGSEIYAVDNNHELADDDQIEQFESEGVATGEADDIDLELTIAEDSDDVQADRFTDAGRLYLEVDYQEDIDRTLRIYVPDEYFHPYEDQSMTTHTDDVTAEMEPIDAGNYTAVTVHMDGATKTTLEVSTVESTIWQYRDGTFDWLDGSLGVDVPRLGGSGDEPWEYVDSRQFAGDERVSISADATVQYDAADNNSETVWLEVPSCSADAPVCTVSQGNETAVLADNASDVPQIRYSEETSLGDRFSAGFREVMEEVRTTVDNVRSGISEVTG